MQRLAIVTTAAPPSASGQARVLEKLLAGELEGRHLFLSDQLDALDAEGSLCGVYKALAPARFQLVGTITHKRMQRLNNLSGLVRDAWVRSSEIVSAISAHPVDAVIGCSGNPFDLPAAAIAAWRLKLPFIAYLFDDPVYQWEPGPYRSLARLWERWWGPRAASVIVPNETLADDVRARVPRAATRIVRNPVDLASIGATGASGADFLDVRAPATPKLFRTILYTGSVYSAQASAFRNLVAALQETEGRFRLQIHTSQSEAQLRDHGVAGPFVERYDHLPQAEALQRQRGADILFLPLAFDSPIPEVVRSSAPAKLAEYLSSGRPVLVHAPQGSFVSSFFAAHRAGLVVDRPSVSELVHALNSLISDANLCEELTTNARAAVQEFSVERAQAAFQAAVTRCG